MTALIVLVAVFACLSLVLAVTSVTGVLPRFAERRRVGRDEAHEASRPGGASAGAEARPAGQAGGNLLSRMSHEIRTPLNSVITLSELLLEGNAGGLGYDQRKYVEIIHRNGQKLLGLINDVLDLSTLEAGRLEIEVSNVEVGGLVQKVIAAATPHAQSKGLVLRFNGTQRPTFARCDPDRLRQALANVVDTSIGMTANGYVEVSIEPGPEQIHIRVSDTGVGLGEDVREHLQDAALHEPTALGAAELENGPRLGLAVASRLITLMGGGMKVESQAGEGALFDLTVPAGVEEAIAIRRAVDETEPAASRVSGKILVIEDDDFERRHVVEILEGVGYDATPAASGEEALNLLREGSYDAAILDLVMPGMSGLDVLRAARSDERLGELPFVVLSALYMTRSEREVLGPNAVAVVRKGEAIKDELMASLKKAIKAPPEIRGPAATGATSPARVLLVEEHPENLYAIQQVLSVLPVTVDTARNLLEAADLLGRGAPDIVLLDMFPEHVPEMTRVVRDRPDSANIPVIDLAQGAREAAPRDGGEEGRHAIQPLEVVSAVSRVLHLAPH